MTLKASSKENNDEKPKHSFLKGILVGSISVGLLASLGFSYMSQEKEVSQAELFFQATPNIEGHQLLEDDPAFSSPEWMAFSKISAEKNLESLKAVDDGNDYSPGPYWWADLKERQAQAQISQQQSTIQLFEKLARRHAVSLAIDTCMGTDPEGIKNRKEMYSDGLAEGSKAMEFAVQSLSKEICGK